MVAVGAALVVNGGLGPRSIDGHAVRAAHHAVLAHPALLSLARAVTQLGAPTVVSVVAVVAAVTLWLTGHRRGALLVAAVRVSTVVVTQLLKSGVGRPRPSLLHPVAHATGFSFPSGHASGAASVYLPLLAIALCRRRYDGRVATGFVAAVVALICVGVAASRVLLGVHYPSDVVAGLAVGAGLTCLGVALIDPCRRSEGTAAPG